MLSSAQNASPRARLLITRHALRSSGPSTSGAAPPASSEQARQLSFGRFTRVTSFLHKEARQRNRVLAYKCMNSLHRYLSWDNGPRPDNSKAAMKKMVAEWLQSDSRANKYTNANEIKSWSDDISGVRPGRSIEDAEREAINHLFRRQVVWTTPIHAMRDHIHASQAPREVTAGDVLHATAGTRDGLNFIDPVTNKRVSGRERGNYSEASIDDPNAPRILTPEEKSKLYEDLGDYNTPTSWNEPDGKRELTPEEESKQYTDLNKYKPEVDDPNKPRELTPEEQSKLYEDLDQYEKPVTWNEPDGNKAPTPEEESKNYEDLDRYEGPVRWNEPDGLRPRTSEEKSKDYKDLGKYRAFAWNEPDGLRPLTPEEMSKQYDDLHTYKGPFVAKASALKAVERLLNDPTVKAKPLAPRVEVQSAPPQYEDLNEYGPVMWNEPDGLRILTPEEKSKQYKDLHFYAQYDNADAESARVHPEVASKQYRDLSGYTGIPDVEARVHPEEASKRYTDLSSYSAFDNSAPEVARIHPEEASKNYDDLDNYPVAGFEESAKTEHVHPEQLTKDYDDLDQYKPQSFDSIERVHPAHPEEATKHYGDLFRYEKATPLVADESAEPMTADEIRFQVLQRAVGASKQDQPESHAEAAADGPEMSSMDESFPREAEAESFAQIPEGLESSPEDPTSLQVSAPAAANAADASGEPSAYKILAYDPATQAISVAETTSAKHHDSSAPQNLGDILLKLSHPSKFLPHFRAAQAQGYDIVAGGGDVLIFRKTRAASIAAGAGREEEPGSSVARAVPEKKRRRSLGRKVVMGTVWVGGVAYAVGALGEGLSVAK
ncbi:hypothetical protein ESCO_005325 [Escovopsis weberi]|uniref:Uncharacterized protein n=1 Tax=Escovopsis weberi TaxID=150374 RepID=A0A0M8MVY3_ESCWE|nr:hypothetical protein ESCO_005325 [Escovopsis weberi]